MFKASVADAGSSSPGGLPWTGQGTGAAVLQRDWLRGCIGVATVVVRAAPSLRAWVPELYGTGCDAPCLTR
jgi:hypothetical protein